MKRIITAETIRQMAHEGKKQLEVNFTECLITPEARVIAAELGVALSEIVASDLAKAPIADKTCALKDKTVGAQPSATELAQIRAAVLAQLPHGAATPRPFTDACGFAGPAASPYRQAWTCPNPRPGSCRPSWRPIHACS